MGGESGFDIGPEGSFSSTRGQILELFLDELIDVLKFDSLNIDCRLICSPAIYFHSMADAVCVPVAAQRVTSKV